MLNGMNKGGRPEAGARENLAAAAANNRRKPKPKPKGGK